MERIDSSMDNLEKNTLSKINLVYLRVDWREKYTAKVNSKISQ